MKLTRDSVLAMSREQILAEDFRDIMDVYMADYGSESTVRDRINSIFTEVVSWQQQAREAFVTKRSDADMADMAARLGKEPPIVQILAWSRLTNQGVDEIEFARFVHKHFANTILSIFGMPVLDRSALGVIPNTPGIFRKA